MDSLSMDVLWNSMDLYGFHGAPRQPPTNFGKLLNLEGFQKFVGGWVLGRLLAIGSHWGAWGSSIDSCGFTWIPMDFNGRLLIFYEII